MTAPITAPILELIDIRRVFGETKAVDGISFAIQAGETVGFIGANGAGKTTTMRLIALLDMPSAGRILYKGKNALEQGAKLRGELGWMPDAYGTYEYTTVAEYMDFFARAYGYSGNAREARVAEVMAFTELDALSDRFIDTLSKGMAQRLCLGRTLLNDPELLVLDEPAAGLDPQARLHFKHLVRLLAKQGKSILISSHILSELEDMCDTFLFIHSGRIVHHGEADTLKRREDSGVMLEIKIRGDAAVLREWLITQPKVEIRESVRDGYLIYLNGGTQDDMGSLLRRAIQEGYQVYDFHEQTMNLEEAFVDLVGKLREEEAEGRPPALERKE